MGYSVPAAVAVSLECPERLVVTNAGDGEFGMNGQEIATAVQHGTAMLIVVLNNGQFAIIRAHQESHFSHRVSGIQLLNPDMTALARLRQPGRDRGRRRSSPGRGRTCA